MTSPTRLALVLCLAFAAPMAEAAASGTRAAVSESAAPAEAQRVLTVRRGDTLGELLASAGVPSAEAQRAIAALRPAFPPRNLAVGQEVGLRLDPDRDNALLVLEIEPNPGHTIALRRQGEGWALEEHVVPRRSCPLTWCKRPRAEPLA